MRLSLRRKRRSSRGTRGTPPASHGAPRISAPTRLRWALQDVGHALGSAGRELGRVGPESARVARAALRRAAEVAGRMRAAAVVLGRLGRRLVGAVAAALGAALERGGRGGRTAAGWAGRRVTPARTAIVAGLGACVLLAASQFADYSAVEIRAPEYVARADLDVLGSLPRTGVESPQAAHGYLVLALALGAAVALALTLRGRWGLGRLAAALGAVAVGVIMAIDLPRGLDGGEVANQYEGAHPILLEGFYAELAAGAALIAAGLLAARYVRLEERMRRRVSYGGGLRSRRVANRTPSPSGFGTS